MTVAELTQRVDALLEACNAAGEDFDHLAYETAQIPAGDFRDTLAVQLTFMADELAKLTLDLRTLPVTA